MKSGRSEIGGQLYWSIPFIKDSLAKLAHAFRYHPINLARTASFISQIQNIFGLKFCKIQNFFKDQNEKMKTFC
jgi:hypothetical protein